MATFLAACLLLGGCDTVLIYTGTIHTREVDEAVKVSNELEQLYLKYGLEHDPDTGWATSRKIQYSRSWYGKCVWLGHKVIAGELHIRITPGVTCQDKSRPLAEEIEAYLQARKPPIRYELEGRENPDWLR
jgi:hypothetical protein